MKSTVTSLVSGLLFGAGLIVSGMVNPAKVLGFLDLTGQWDPSLALVMVSAIAISWVGVRLAARRPETCHLARPSRTGIDRQLILGSVLFGVGWGLTGLCPGPVVAATGSLFWPAAVVLVAMLVGLKVGRKA